MDSSVQLMSETVSIRCALKIREQHAFLNAKVKLKGSPCLIA